METETKLLLFIIVVVFIIIFVKFFGNEKEEFINVEAVNNLNSLANSNNAIVTNIQLTNGQIYNVSNPNSYPNELGMYSNNNINMLSNNGNINFYTGGDNPTMSIVPNTNGNSNVNIDGTLYVDTICVNITPGTWGNFRCLNTNGTTDTLWATYFIGPGNSLVNQNDIINVNGNVTTNQINTQMGTVTNYNDNSPTISIGENLQITNVNAGSITASSYAAVSDDMIFGCATTHDACNIF